MTKYEICTESFEFRFGKKRPLRSVDSDTIFDWINQEMNRNQHYRESYDTKEEALAAFEPYRKMVCTYKTDGWTSALLIVEAAFIEINEYDEDGEILYGGDILDYAVAPFKCEYDEEE